MKKKKKYIETSLWKMGLFSLNNAATNLYMAMMVYVSYYINGIAGVGVAVLSILLTGMRIFDGVTDPIAGFLLDRLNGRFGKFRPFMIAGNLMMAGCSALLFYTTHLMMWVSKVHPEIEP